MLGVWKPTNTQTNKQACATDSWWLSVMSPLPSRQPWPQTTQNPYTYRGSVQSPLLPPPPQFGQDGCREGVGGSGGWKGTGQQMASYLSLLCEGCHSNRLMQGSPKEKKRQRQSRKGLGKTMEPRAAGQICRLGHNRWSFFNRQGPTVAGNMCCRATFKRSPALFTYDSANG